MENRYENNEGPVVTVVSYETGPDGMVLVPERKPEIRILDRSLENRFDER